MSFLMRLFKKPPTDPMITESYSLAFKTMMSADRIYFWAFTHNVGLKANKSRLLKNGLLEYCVFNYVSIEEAEKSAQ